MGKPKYIETPERLYELFEEYKANLKPREIQKATPRGVVSEFHKPPLTIEGFKVYCWKNHSDINRYFYNVDGAFSDYVSICSRIKEEIRQDQIEGGMVGQYNPSITQRLNGLTEKQEVEHKGTVDNIKIEIVKPKND